MKKFNYLCGAAFACAAMFMVSCSVQDDPVEPSIKNGDDVSTVITDNIEVINGVPTLNLPAGVSLSLNAEITSDAPLTIKGDPEDPAIIKIGAEGKFITKNAIQFENVIIDATEQTQPFVTLGEEAPEDWEFASVGFFNVDIHGLKKALFYAACKNYDVVTYIENSRIEVAADVTVFDYTKGSVPLILSIANSTIWAPEPTTKAFFSSQGGQKATDFAESALEVFQFSKSTFYNLTKGKNFFTHRQSNQKWLTYTVQDCIFVNCGKSGQTIKGMNGGQGGKNPEWFVTGNVFNFEGADTSADESTGDDDQPITDSKAVVVNFADVAFGDFTQSDAEAGDPIWIK